MKLRPEQILVAILILVPYGNAQSSTQHRDTVHVTSGQEYWIDPSTGLMWAGKDNGEDVNWKNAKKYCSSLRVAEFSDWRLPTIDELEEIHDPSARVAGLGGKDRSKSQGFHVRGNLFLSGNPWSSTVRRDHSGKVTGFAWYFDFVNDRRWRDPTDHKVYRTALCVRRADE